MDDPGTRRLRNIKTFQCHSDSIDKPAFLARLLRDTASSLRAGDSPHLAVALECGVKFLTTLDADLEVNAKRQGLETIRF